MKEKIELRDWAGHITAMLPRGILLNTNGEKFNSMVIGWGALGTVWGRSAFTVYVRQSRYTKAQLDSTGEFTISVPLEKPDPEITRVCGTQSGYTVDKTSVLTPAQPGTTKTPGVKEYPLTLECRVIYAQDQDISLLPAEIRDRNYPQDVPGDSPMANRDHHTAYIGQIVDAYIIKE